MSGIISRVNNDIIETYQGQDVQGDVGDSEVLSALADIVTVNIKSIGAKTDGSDCRSIINQAIQKVGQGGGGTVWIPSGTFDITLDPTTHIGIVCTYSNVRITGVGKIRLKAGTLTGTINYSPLMVLIDTVSSNETDTIENVTIEGITFDQNWQNNSCVFTGYSCDAITIRHCINPQIRNNKIINVIDSGIMYTSNKRGSIKNNRIEGVLREIFDGSITSGTSIFTSSTANFSNVDIGSTVFIQQAGNAGEPFKAKIVSVQSSTQATLDTNALNTVSNNWSWIGNADAGIYISDPSIVLSDGANPFDAENTRKDRNDQNIISDNRIINFLGTGIHCNRGVTRLVITNNTFKYAWVGIDLSWENQTAIPQKNKIANNEMENIGRIGIALNMAHFSTVINNTVLNSFIGVDLEGASYCTVSNNTLIGTLVAVGSQVGILINLGAKDGTNVYASYNVISNNVVTKYWYGIQDTNGCVGNIYNNNSLMWVRSATSVTALYVFNSANRCVNGVWYASDLTASPIPQVEGTLGVQSGVFKMYLSGVWRKTYKPASNQYSAGATSVDASFANFVMINANTVATNVSSIINGETGQELALYFTNNFTTLVNGGNLRLSGNVNYTPAAKTAMKFICLDGTVWSEISRTTQG